MARWKFWDFFRTQNDFGVFTRKDGIEAVMVGLGINRQTGEAHGVKSPFSPLNIGAESQNPQDPPGAGQGSLQAKSLVPTRP